MLLVFILSHGHRNGLINTDHKVDEPEKVASTSADTSDKHKFQTFTTTEVLTSLKLLKGFESSLKIVFFGVSQVC